MGLGSKSAHRLEARRHAWRHARRQRGVAPAGLERARCDAICGCPQLDIDLVACSCVFSGLADGQRRQVDLPGRELWGFVSLYNREAEVTLVAQQEGISGSPLEASSS